MHRQVHWPLYLNLMVGVMLLVGAGLAITEAAEPKQATFDITNTFTVKVPQQAQTLRIWFAVPQADAESTIANFKVEAPSEVRYSADSQGNRVGYIEIQNPKGEQITIREAFAITRREILGNVDPAQTRPLTADEKASMADELKPSTYVLVNDEMKALAAQIVGDEDNPIGIARKLYDWTLDNIDYWVKEPERLKASSVGSTGQTKGKRMTDESASALPRTCFQDMGELSCGDLVMAILKTLRSLQPGDVVELRALDPAAPIDIPAWCRLTGHTLVSGPCGPDTAHYFIRKKENG